MTVAALNVESDAPTLGLDGVEVGKAYDRWWRTHRVTAGWLADRAIVLRGCSRLCPSLRRSTGASKRSTMAWRWFRSPATTVWGLGLGGLVRRSAWRNVTTGIPKRS